MSLTTIIAVIAAFGLLGCMVLALTAQPDPYADISKCLSRTGKVWSKGDCYDG
jgi:hypothetical protein